MKEIVQHSIYGEIVYNESFWTGKKALTINGVDAKPISKKEYMVNEKRAILKGSFLTGSTLLIEGETIQLSPKAKWYEIILAIIPFTNVLFGIVTRAMRANWLGLILNIILCPLFYIIDLVTIILSKDLTVLA